MRKLFTIILCCLLAANVQAQIVSSHSRSITAEKDNFPDYSRIEISYSPMSWEDPETSFTGIKFGFLHGESISNTAPLYFEYGINAHYAWSDDEIWKGNVTTSVLNLNIPVNFAYKFDINDDVHITPYVGLHLRGNIIGQKKYEYDDKTSNFFDKDDMGSSKLTANRIQLGGQIGAGIDYKRLYVGVGYNTQISEYMKGVNTSGLDVTIGYNF